MNMLQRFAIIKMKIVHRYGKYWMEMRFHKKGVEEWRAMEWVGARKCNQNREMATHREGKEIGECMHKKTENLTLFRQFGELYRVTLFLCLYIAVGLTDCFFAGTPLVCVLPFVLPLVFFLVFFYTLYFVCGFSCILYNDYWFLRRLRHFTTHTISNT